MKTLGYSFLTIFAVALSGCGGGSGSGGGGTTPDVNYAPVAVAGADAVAAEGTVIIIDGSTSSDSDGDTLTFEWAQIDGPEAGMASADSAEVEITLPATTEPVDLTFELTVTDPDGESATDQVVISAEPAFTIAALITDAPLVNAEVTVVIGSNMFETTTDSNGNYELLVHAADTTATVRIQAQGTGDQAHVTLVNQLGSFASLDALAGSTGSLDSETTPAVDTTHITTARTVLIEASAGEEPLTAELLEELESLVDTSEIFALATLIQIAADHPVPLPEGVSNTLELVQVEGAAEAFEEAVEVSNPGLVDEVAASVLAEAASGLGFAVGEEIDAIMFRPGDLKYNSVVGLQVAADGMSGAMVNSEFDMALVDIANNEGAITANVEGGTQMLMQYFDEQLQDHVPFTHTITNVEISKVFEGSRYIDIRLGFGYDIDRPVEAGGGFSETHEIFLKMLKPDSSLPFTEDEFPSAWYMDSLVDIAIEGADETQEWDAIYFTFENGIGHRYIDAALAAWGLVPGLDPAGNEDALYIETVPGTGDVTSTAVTRMEKLADDVYQALGDFNVWLADGSTLREFRSTLLVNVREEVAPLTAESILGFWSVSQGQIRFDAPIMVSSDDFSVFALEEIYEFRESGELRLYVAAEDIGGEFYQSYGYEITESGEITLRSCFSDAEGDYVAIATDAELASADCIYRERFELTALANSGDGFAAPFYQHREYEPPIFPETTSNHEQPLSYWKRMPAPGAAVAKLSQNVVHSKVAPSTNGSLLDRWLLEKRTPK